MNWALICKMSCPSLEYSSLKFVANFFSIIRGFFLALIVRYFFGAEFNTLSKTLSDFSDKNFSQSCFKSATK